MYETINKNALPLCCAKALYQSTGGGDEQVENRDSCMVIFKMNGSSYLSRQACKRDEQRVKKAKH